MIGTHWLLMGGLLFWYSEERPGRAAAPPSPLLAIPNVTAHPSTASVPTSYYSMWQLPVPIKGLKGQKVIMPYNAHTENAQ